MIGERICAVFVAAGIGYFIGGTWIAGLFFALATWAFIIGEINRRDDVRFDAIAKQRMTDDGGREP